jgi:hypothetical protein
LSFFSYLSPLQIHLVICILFDSVEVSMHIFHLINYSYNNSFELKIWDFMPFTIIQILCYVIVDLLRYHIALLFHILVLLLWDLLICHQFVGWGFSHLNVFPLNYSLFSARTG